MKTFKSIFLLILSGLFFTSCMSYVQLTKTLPPEITIYDNESLVQYISLYDPHKLEYNSDKRIDVHVSGEKKVKEGLIQAFTDNREFDLIYYDSSYFARDARENFTKPLHTDSVKLFCSFDSVPLLLTLDTYSIFYDKELDSYQTEDGAYKETAHYYLIVKAGFSLYDSTGFLIDRSDVSLSEYIDTRETFFLGLAIRPSFGNKKPLIDRMSFDIGKQYIDKFYPSTVHTYESYYITKEFEEITPYIKNENWEKAKELLLNLYASPNLKRITRIRLLHNLSTVYKALNDHETAQKYADLEQKTRNRN